MAARSQNSNAPVSHPAPYLLQASQQPLPNSGVQLQTVDNPVPRATLGDLGIATRVEGPDEFPLVILVQPYDYRGLAGIDQESVRVFRWDSQSQAMTPVWRSGLNSKLGYVWAEIRQPGIYLPIGLPIDRTLREMLYTLAHRRHFAHTSSPEEMQAITGSILAPFLAMPEAELESMRQRLARVSVQTGLPVHSPGQIRIGRGAAVQPFPLPGNASLAEFRERLKNLEAAPGGLPEEALFSPPEQLRTPQGEPGSLASPRLTMTAIAPSSSAETATMTFDVTPAAASDWWMYHHDPQHTGAASGSSDITSTTAGRLKLQVAVPLDGPVISIPSIVGGKVYVGVGNSSRSTARSGGTIYRIELASGSIEQTYTFDTPPNEGPNNETGGSNQGYAGIGCSPAVVDGKVYFSALNGKVYCLDAETLQPVWITNLRHPDPAHNQPVQHPVNAEGWCSPLVVNGRVYIGFGEGESGAFGFVYCLDAATGNVIWLFCTNQFDTTADNSPNVIPESAAGAPLPPGFSTHPDPPAKGVSVWSSCAYDADLNRIYVGTGNSNSGQETLPDAFYGSGVLSLDAGTGQFRGYFQPSVSDSYRPTDMDIDIPSSPVLFTRGNTKIVAIGSKNGSFFLLDADSMAVIARRQLLPYDQDGNPFPAIDPTAPGEEPENKSGIFGTAAVHSGLGRIFVGLGGYGGAIDSATTPFMRVLDWNTLDDAWVTAGDNPPLYTVPVPPMYTTPKESGLTSPAVVNDVVFIGTSKPALYGLAASTGLALWTADGLGTAADGNYILGPAIYGNAVIVGLARGHRQGSLYIYSL